MYEYDVFKFSKRQDYLLDLTILIIGIAISFFFYRSIIFGIIIFPFVKRIKEWVGEILIDKRRRELILQFKDFLFVASTALGSGYSMREVVRESIPRIASVYGREAVLVKELQIMDKMMNEGGESDLDVLSEFAKRTGQEDIIDFVTIYSICKSTGASLIIALNQATSIIMDKMTIDKEIREMSRTKMNEGLIIFAMPFLIIIFLNIFSPDYILPLYATWIGRIIMTAVVLSNILIYSIIRKITRIEI